MRANPIRSQLPGVRAALCSTLIDVRHHTGLPDRAPISNACAGMTHCRRRHPTRIQLRQACDTHAIRPHAGIVEQRDAEASASDACIRHAQGHALKRCSVCPRGKGTTHVQAGAVPAAIGVVKGMKDQWKKDRDNLLKTATMRKGVERDKWPRAALLPRRGENGQRPVGEKDRSSTN